MLRPGQVIALCVFALLTIGVVMVNSAGMAVAPVDSSLDSVPSVSTRSILLSRSTVYMGLAILAMGVGSMLPVRRAAAVLAGGRDGREGLAPLMVGAGALVVVCALVYVPGLSREVNGSNRWLRLPGLGTELSLQPSELAKWGLVVVIAWYGAARARVLHEFWAGLVPALLAVGAVAGFIIVEDLGTGTLIAAVACLMLLAAGARVWHFAMFVPLAVLGLVGAILTSPYRVKRILAFIDPYADPQGIGYHAIQSLVAIAGGKGFGRGLGHGLQKFNYLPEDTTDFIFAIICEELGIAGAAVVIGLFGALLWAGFVVMRRESDAMLRLVALGVVGTVALQAIINLAVVTALAPTKGIALPLLSSGGTGWILTAFSMGLLVAIDRTQTEDAGATARGLGAVPASSAY